MGLDAVPIGVQYSGVTRYTKMYYVPIIIMNMTPRFLPPRRLAVGAQWMG